VPTSPRSASLQRGLRHRDLLIVLVLVVGAELEVLLGARYAGRPEWPGPVALNVVLVPALMVPLLWRRSRPVASVVTSMTVLAAMSLALGGTEGTTGFVFCVVATFSAGAYIRRVTPVAVFLLAVALVHVLFDPSVHGPADYVFGLGLFAIAFVIGRAVHARESHIGVLQEDVNQAQRRQAQLVAEATAAERSALARDLHDIVAHAVSVIAIQAQAGARALPGDTDRAADALATIESSAREALTELRHLVTLDEERPAALEPVSSLRNLPDLVRRVRDAGLQVELDVPSELPVLSPSGDLAAYRVVQEALTNTMRHAPGASARLRIRCQGDAVEILAEDGGARDPSKPVTTGAGRGLIGMRERLRLAGGELAEAGPVPSGEGYRVRARIPVERAGA
jgi:signal transduction histidine kinase